MLVRDGRFCADRAAGGLWSMAGGWREFGACPVPSGWAGLAEGWRGPGFLAWITARRLGRLVSLRACPVWLGRAGGRLAEGWRKAGGRLATAAKLAASGLVSCLAAVGQLTRPAAAVARLARQVVASLPRRWELRRQFPGERAG